MDNQILNALANSNDKGQLLEDILSQILKDIGYINVRSQNKGSQYGFDIYAEKIIDGRKEVWKFECKNLKTDVKIEDIAPKLIWQFTEPINIDKFVIVCPFDLSNEVHHLLEIINLSFEIEIWNREYLSYIISQSPNALKKLNVKNLSPTTSNQVPLKFTPKEIRFFAFHRLFDSPYSFAYFFLNNQFIKAHTEDHFKVVCVFNNTSNTTFYVNSIQVRTLKYENISSRIIRQHKLKGVFEPEKFYFTPNPTHLGSVEVLEENKLFKVPPKEEEAIILELSHNSLPGYYELIVTAKGQINGKAIELTSHILPLHIRSKKDNLVLMQTLYKHYDTPMKKMLEINEAIWTDLLKSQSIYLNPHKEVNNQLRQSKNWRLNYTKGRLSKEIDTGIPIEEKIFDLSDIFKNIPPNLKEM